MTVVRRLKASDAEFREDAQPAALWRAESQLRQVRGAKEPSAGIDHPLVGDRVALSVLWPSKSTQAGNLPIVRGRP